jgi:excisionase family DNA binding protein
LAAKEFMSIREIAEYLGCGRNQSYKIIQPGPRSLPAYRCGHKILVRRRDLEAWLEKNRYQSKPTTGSDNHEDAKAVTNQKEKR